MSEWLAAEPDISGSIDKPEPVGQAARALKPIARMAGMSCAIPVKH